MKRGPVGNMDKALEMKQRMGWIKLVMIGSWLAGAGLCCVSVASANLECRFVSVFMLALMLAPTVVLALRQVERESVMRALRDKKQGEPELQPESSEPEQSGIFVDALTGLASRRYLTMFLQREFSRSQRAGKPLALAVFDVDEFSKLEGKLGSEAAGSTLADIGARMKSALRDYDLAARYADGRIVVVLPETDKQAAEDVVRRLHGLATSVCADGQPVSVTVGLSTFPEHGTTADELINSAHHALNRGKAECSNQVHTREGIPKAA